MPKTKPLICEVCLLPDGIPKLKLVLVETKEGNYYACPACLFQEKIEQTYQELGQLIEQQNYYFHYLARFNYKQIIKSHA